MTRKKLEFLARRAVACKRWRWMPGMLAVEWAAAGMSLTGGRPVRVDERWHEVGVWLPDLSDPATLGCLLALVRKVYPNTRFMQDGWRMTSTLFLVHAGMDWELERRCYDAFEKLNVDGTWSQSGQDCIRVKSEAEALVAALEAAP